MQSLTNTTTEATTTATPVLLLIGHQAMHRFVFTPGRNTQFNIKAAQSLYTFAELTNDVKVAYQNDQLTIDDEPLENGAQFELNGIQVWWGTTAVPDYLDVLGHDEVYVGHQAVDDVQIANTLAFFRIRFSESGMTLDNFAAPIFVNMHLYDSTEPLALKSGDLLFVDGNEIEVQDHLLKLTNYFGKVTTKLNDGSAFAQQLPEDYPSYHRSPRIIYRSPEDQVKVDQPADKPTSPDSQLAKVIVPPLVMVAMSILVSMAGGRSPIMMMSMAGMSVATIFFSITAYVKGKRDFKENSKKRVGEYEQYLTKKTVEMNRLAEKQALALNYHYPSLNEIQAMVENVNSRIYEKTALQHDFLTYRLGVGNVPATFKISFDEDPFTKDDLVKEGQNLVRDFRQVKGVPIVSSLQNGPVGFIGRRRLVVEQIQSLILQIATLQSYHDVQFISIFPEDELPKWKWMRWLPHSTLQGMNVRGFVYHERSRDQILNSLYQILKDRELEYKEHSASSEQQIFTPHYVVFATYEELILDHTIMEFFSKDLSHLGVSMVFVEEVIQSLPEQVTTVVDIADHNHGEIIIDRTVQVHRHFTPDHFDENFDKEMVARQLGALDHQESLKNSIPKSVTFMEMYGKQRIEQLEIGKRWATNEPFKSLAVPLGLRGKDDIVKLDLHERAHGPHGLIAGTTGSGKSELVQSYILSLAVNFEPNDVGFLLIDYKGGGMANQFRTLPHMLGAITNLDGAQSMRALDSIKAELRRRQRLFGEHDVNHINDYQRLFKKGEATEPMPHLFLISDEFAELKTGQPEFMAELVSTARIGRSLGIHLILATQKPTGVVDDQIWSNSKFKISLKVQDVADSNEILKTPDAASIVEPGRAYLQVGNNEIYELFQSAYSGAKYVPDAESETVDRTIYSINDLGQYEVLTKDLSEETKTVSNEDNLTELESIINYIAQYAKDNHIERLPQPWLPPLASRISIVSNESYPDNWKQALNLEVAIGIVDVPSEQDQRPLIFNVEENSHTAIFASPGYGKSTFLQTVVMQLARQNSPDQVNFYLLDFGTNGLLPLRDLPHVADIIRADEDEKIGKYMKLMDEEIKRRKRLLNQAGVASLSQYESATGNHLPIIENVIDGLDGITNAKFEEPFRELTGVIAREGSSLGIYLLITAAQHSALRIRLAGNIQTQIALFLIDSDDVTNIVGRTQMKGEDMPGRGIIKLDEPRAFQTYLPNDGEDSLTVIEKVQAEAKQMADAWSGELPEPIPMVPEEFGYEEFVERKDVRDVIDKGLIPLGLELDTTEPVGIDTSGSEIFVVSSDNGQQLNNYGNLILSILKTNLVWDNVVVLDGTDNLSGENIAEYSNDTTSMQNTSNRLKDEVTARIDGKSKDDSKIIVLINDLESFVKISKIEAADFERMLTSARENDIYYIINTLGGFMQNRYDDFVKVVKKLVTEGIFATRIADQVFVDMAYNSRTDGYPAINEAHFFSGHSAKPIKVPIMGDE